MSVSKRSERSGPPGTSAGRAGAGIAGPVTVAGHPIVGETCRPPLMRKPAGLFPATTFCSPPALALWPATDKLLRTEDRRKEICMAMRTAAGHAQADSSARESLRRIETNLERQDLETAVKYLPRPRQQGPLGLAHWSRPIPAKLAPFFIGADIPARNSVPSTQSAQQFPTINPCFVIGYLLAAAASFGGCRSIAVR